MNPNEPVPFQSKGKNYPSWRDSSELAKRAAVRRQMRAALGRPERQMAKRLVDAFGLRDSDAA